MLPLFFETGTIGKKQIPPDLVVKFQPIDIVDVILWQIMQLRVGYIQKIKG